VANVKEVLAQNLKKHRKRLGITQPELAERAGLSTHYLGMIEVARNFPTADVLERLAAALGIKSNELFSVTDSPEIAMEQLQTAILGKLDQKLLNFEQVIECAVKKAVEENFSNKIPPSAPTPQTPA
jgi:transcriptional regulator with XRE-family HTH domain